MYSRIRLTLSNVFTNSAHLVLRTIIEKLKKSVPGVAIKLVPDAFSDKTTELLKSYLLSSLMLMNSTVWSKSNEWKMLKSLTFQVFNSECKVYRKPKMSSFRRRDMKNY